MNAKAKYFVVAWFLWITANVLIYLSFAFIEAELNPAHWALVDRIISVIISCIALKILLQSTYELAQEKGREQD